MSRPKSQQKMVQISISLSHELIEQIEQMAAADNRNRSNFIANTLRKVAEEKLGKLTVKKG